MPRNTTNDSTVEKLANSFPGGIENQEAAGQADLVKDDTLPTEITEDCQVMLEKAGVIFKGPVKDDPLFQHVILPKGWKKLPTLHDMWSHLEDDKYKLRAKIFYKAAFYDRRARMVLA